MNPLIRRSTRTTVKFLNRGSTDTWKSKMFACLRSEFNIMSCDGSTWDVLYNIISRFQRRGQRAPGTVKF
jgi:hypothetical protein